MAEASGTVKLRSSDGFDFVVDYKAACISNTVKNLLSMQGVPAVHVKQRLIAQVHHGASAPGWPRTHPA